MEFFTEKAINPYWLVEEIHGFFPYIKKENIRFIGGEPTREGAACNIKIYQAKEKDRKMLQWVIDGHQTQGLPDPDKLERIKAIVYDYYPDFDLVINRNNVVRYSPWVGIICRTEQERKALEQLMVERGEEKVCITVSENYIKKEYPMTNKLNEEKEIEQVAAKAKDSIEQLSVLVGNLNVSGTISSLEEKLEQRIAALQKSQNGENKAILDMVSSLEQKIDEKNIRLNNLDSKIDSIQKSVSNLEKWASSLPKFNKV